MQVVHIFQPYLNKGLLAYGYMKQGLMQLRWHRKQLLTKPLGKVQYWVKKYTTGKYITHLQIVT